MRIFHFFAWGDRHGTQEWVQYDFDAPKEISSAEVYWAIGSWEEYKWNPPVSWRLQYQENGQWKDVETSGPYGIVADQFNRVTFRPVTTQALRLLAQLPGDATSGIFEWRVNTSKGKEVEPLSEIEPTGRFELQGDSLIWTIELRNNGAQAD